MIFVNDKLPLEYPPKEMMIIYRDRLFLFSGVVMGNLLLLALAIFALVHPFIFIIGLGLVGAFVFVCWWASRDAVLARSNKTLNRTPIGLSRNVKEIFAKIIAISSIFGFETDETNATLILQDETDAKLILHVETPFGMEEHLAVREFLEISRGFQRYLVDVFLYTFVEKYATRNKKIEWFRFAQSVGKTYARISAVLDKMAEKDLCVDITHRIPINVPEKLNSWLLLSSYVKDFRVLRKVIEGKSAEDAFIIIRRYITLAPHVWNALLSTDITSAFREEIKSVKELLFQQRRELLNLSKQRQQHIILRSYLNEKD